MTSLHSPSLSSASLFSSPLFLLPSSLFSFSSPLFSLYPSDIYSVLDGRTLETHISLPSPSPSSTLNIFVSWLFFPHLKVVKKVLRDCYERAREFFLGDLLKWFSSKQVRFFFVPVVAVPANFGPKSDFFPAIGCLLTRFFRPKSVVFPSLVF